MDSPSGSLQRAQLALELNPLLEENQLEVTLVNQLLNELDSSQAVWVDKVLQARWAADGDKSSKLFFKSFKSMAAAKHIPALVNDAVRESLT